MKRSKFTDSQIGFALKQAETGTTAAEDCRNLGISEATLTVEEVQRVEVDDCASWKKRMSG